MVWARNGFAITECPKSYVSSQSLSLLEEYAVWKAVGPVAFGMLTARQAEAFHALDLELTKEARDAQG